MTTTKKSRRHGLLLEEPKIKAWFDEVSPCSLGTSKNYLRTVGLFAERSSVSLISFPDLPNGPWSAAGSRGILFARPFRPVLIPPFFFEEVDVHRP